MVECAGFSGDPTSGGRSFALRFLLDESAFVTTTCEPLGVRIGAFVACGSAGRLRLARSSNMWSALVFLALLEPGMGLVPDGGGVDGVGFAGDTVSAFRLRLLGRGVEGLFGIVKISAGFVTSRDFAALESVPVSVVVSERLVMFVGVAVEVSGTLRFFGTAAFFGVAFFGAVIVVFVVPFVFTF